MNNLTSNQNKKPLDRTTQIVVLYLISRLDGVLGKTHLQKMLFLSDLMSVKKFKEQLTAFAYKKHLFGPFCNEVDQYIESLKSNGLIEERKIPLLSNPEQTYSRYYLKKQVSGAAKTVLAKEIGPDKIILVDEIIDSFGNMSLQDLLDIVYDLQLVKKSEKGECLPLDRAKEIKDMDEPEVDFFEGLESD
jgi:hypothetical protein